jgi:hypothetical protein
VKAALPSMAIAERPFGSSAILGPSGVSLWGVTEEARTRGFAAPALAGCAFVDGWLA